MFTLIVGADPTMRVGMSDGLDDGVVMLEGFCLGRAGLTDKAGVRSRWTGV